MNAGYVFYVLLLCSVILTAFDWRKQLYGEIRKLHLILFYIGWLLCIGLSLQINQIYIHGTALWIGLLASIAVLRFRSKGQLLLLFSVCSLFSSIYLLLRRLSDYYPLIVITYEWLDFAIVLSLFSAMMYKEVSKQLLLISSGLVLGEILYIKMAEPLTISIGGLDMADLWWMTFLLARVWSGAAWVVARMLKPFLRS